MVSIDSEGPGLNYFFRLGNSFWLGNDFWSRKGVSSLLRDKNDFLFKKRDFWLIFLKKFFEKFFYTKIKKKIPRRVSLAVFFDEDTAEAAIGAK